MDPTTTTHEQAGQIGEGVGRRGFFALGATLTGASLLHAIPFTRAHSALAGTYGEEAMPIAHATNELTSLPGIVVKTGGHKPVYLPASDVRDPATLSLAESLFWTDIMMEHARLIQLHLPGPELEPRRSEAAGYEKQFRSLFMRAAEGGLDASNYVAFNVEVLKVLSPFIAFKRALLAGQESGAVRGLAWPSLLDHIADEAEEFRSRLRVLTRGEADLINAQRINFWLETMQEHFEVVAHMLDPREKTLIAEMQKMALRLQGLTQRGLAAEDASRELKSIIAFKEDLVRDVDRAAIASIILPSLADHVRREAEKAHDDVLRAV